MPEPTKIPRPFADSGDKNSIPDSSGGLGFASWQEGFPAITSEPFAQGGVAPKRADFNGIFNALSLATVWQQQGGFYAYDATTDYEVGNVVEYNNDLYKCITANGPGSAVKAPTDTTVWSKVMTADDVAARYLPLSGGTITGNTINFSNTAPNLNVNRNDAYFRVLNNGYANGGSLYLFGKSYSDATRAGGFTLNAKNDNNAYALNGLPDGTLTWASKDIAVVDSVDSTTSGYIRFTNGLQIVWGDIDVTSESGTAVTFEKAFSSAPRIFMDVAFGSAYGYGYAPQALSRTTTGCTMYIGSSRGGAAPQFGTGHVNYFAIGPWSA